MKRLIAAAEEDNRHEVIAADRSANLMYVVIDWVKWQRKGGSRGDRCIYQLPTCGIIVANNHADEGGGSLDKRVTMFYKCDDHLMGET